MKQIAAGVADPVTPVVAAIKAAGAKATVLVVGHSNTIPAIAKKLGDPAAGDRRERLRHHDRDPAGQARAEGDPRPLRRADALTGRAMALPVSRRAWLTLAGVVAVGAGASLAIRALPREGQSGP